MFTWKFWPEHCLWLGWCNMLGWCSMLAYNLNRAQFFCCIAFSIFGQSPVLYYSCYIIAAIFSLSWLLLIAECSTLGVYHTHAVWLLLRSMLSNRAIKTHACSNTKSLYGKILSKDYTNSQYFCQIAPLWTKWQTFRLFYDVIKYCCTKRLWFECPRHNIIV